ncbi:MBL fold metallo-hydrolase [Cumulibacter soli]|uniref:MBL fold metallo-hydrolase n=1 Tax=Cumulibacter soli TaxID=2546344 RepID=UPI001067725C|nr:MBL fold metallo-hydrolase [Cumulibacter soli]
MHTLQVGSVNITALLDAPFLQSLAYLSPEHAAELEDEYRDTLDERGLCTGAVTCYLVRTADGLALVDTGIGPRKRKGFPHGRLDAALAEAGVSPTEIDLVIHTHLHIDHVGWNTYETPDGGCAIFFPNARFVIQQAEWDYWMAPEQLDAPDNAVLRECVAPLRDSGRVDLVDANARYLGAIGFIANPGHTPGHVAVEITDGAERAVIVGDSCHHPFQVTHSSWPSPMDVDANHAIEARGALYDRLADSGAYVLGGHWKHPGWGQVVRTDGERRFVPGI